MDLHPDELNELLDPMRSVFPHVRGVHYVPISTPVGVVPVFVFDLAHAGRDEYRQAFAFDRPTFEHLRSLMGDISDADLIPIDPF